MRHVRGIRRWCEGGDLPAAYRHMSYALFRTDTDGMEILGARCPDHKALPVGKSLLAALELTDEAVTYLKGPEMLCAPYFMETKLGVGLLHRGYDRQAGVGLYLHVHGNPASLCRLLRGGVLSGGNGSMRIASDMEDTGPVRPWDEEAYIALQDAWSEIRDRQREGGVWNGEGKPLLATYELEQGLSELAAFAGVGLSVARDAAYPGGDEGVDPLPVSVRCYSPRLLEALLLFHLTAAGQLSADGRAICRVASRGINRHLLMSLEYPVAEKTLAGEEAIYLQEAFRHMELVAELSGLDLQAAVMMPSRKEKQAGKLPVMSVCVEWLYDPAILPTADLKARLRLRYGGEE